MASLEGFFPAGPWVQMHESRAWCPRNHADRPFDRNVTPRGASRDFWVSRMDGAMLTEVTDSGHHNNSVPYLTEGGQYCGRKSTRFLFVGFFLERLGCCIDNKLFRSFFKDGEVK